MVIGYITAGIVIRPVGRLFRIGFGRGTDLLAAQIGLVFLIFSIGRGCVWQRLKRVGFPLILATALIAVLVLLGCRVLGAAFGWPGVYSLVLAGMLMVSSPVLGKSLRKANATHSRFGQTALTVTALDDLLSGGDADGAGVNGISGTDQRDGGVWDDHPAQGGDRDDGDWGVAAGAGLLNRLGRAFPRKSVRW